MSVTIYQLSLSNFKGIVEVLEMEPSPTGLTVVGGPNRSGKTSFINGLSWLLGGEKFRPSKPWRDGSATPPELHAVLSNGIIVNRKGKNSNLTVTDPTGKRGNQTLLKEFVDEWSLDLGKFLRANPKDKATILLEIIGIADELAAADALIEKLYGEREIHGRETTRKEKYAAELPSHKDTPAEETSAVALIEEIQKIQAANAENKEQRRDLAEMAEAHTERVNDIARLTDQFSNSVAVKRKSIEDMKTALAVAEQQLAGVQVEYKKRIEDENAEFAQFTELRRTRTTEIEQLTDQPTDALQEQLEKCEETNARVRANTEKKSATVEAAELRTAYEVLTGEVESARGARIALLNGADLPLPGLGIESGELTYESMPWDNMATSDQYKAGTAIVSRKNPECGILLIDKIEALDVDELRDFGKWAESEDLQVICTRVSTGDECTLIIEDGEVVQAEA